MGSLCLGLPLAAPHFRFAVQSTGRSTNPLRKWSVASEQGLLKQRRSCCRAHYKEDTANENEIDIPASKGAGKDDAAVEQAEQAWIAPKYRVILMTSLAFVICNMDKVNLSVAIIPMSHQFGWPATTSGLVQSSFFLGYGISQLPGGWLSRNLTGKYVLRAGVFLWSIATAAIPFSARWFPGILACRLLVGLGEGVSPSAATDLVARTVSAQERSRAVSVVFSGLSVRSIAGLLLAPAFIENYGWESVFYVFGVLGILWCLAFNPEASETDDISVVDQPSDDSTRQPSKVPWSAIFKSPAVWAMIYAHFCGNWGYFNLLSWMPTFFSEELHLDLTNAALVSILPPLASVPVSAVASLWADNMISSGMNTTLVRKICQSIAFVCPSACMGIVSLYPSLPPWSVVLLLSSGIGLSSFSLSGLYCTHQDISRKYASILLGITNTAGALPGLIGVATTGYLLDQTNSWTTSLFLPSIFFYLSGMLVWDLLANCEPQTFEP